MKESMKKLFSELKESQKTKFKFEGKEFEVTRTA